MMMARRPDWIFDGSEIEDTFGDGERAVDFIRRLKHPKSPHLNKEFDLPFFWERIIRRIYGPRHPDGRRKVRTVFCLLPRGARKTTMGAALSLLHTFGHERTPAGQAMVGASAEEQAKIAFDEALAIAEATPWLDKVARPTASELLIEHPKSKATFRALSSDGKAKLGTTPSFVLADELIVWRNRELWKALRTGLAKTPGTLMVIITQAGRGQDNLAFEVLEYARKVADGEVKDPGFLPVLFEADQHADWRDEDLWHFVNPGLSEGFPDLEGLRQFAREAEERPSERDDFRQYHLNVWLDYSASPFVEMAVYDEGADHVNLDDLRGEPCWIAVDMGLTTDLTAVVACWRDGDDGFQVYAWFFVPADNLRGRAERDGVPYPLWAQQGFIIPTPGNVTDYRVVTDHIRGLCDQFDVQEIAFDPAYAQAVMGPLTDDGFPTATMRQGWVTMGPAIKELERAILGRSFRHGGNPVLRWNFSNVVVENDKAGNKSFHKGKSKDRIDGAVATAMAVARCAAADVGRSAYASDDFSEEMGWF
ncbi:terminase large subunit [Gellertiella hungarica]|uniref:Phage terminase large subunit-like protein n=1 Tax=Gellertiella hungarica TaxID=1572859 RepID=A0A7W6NKP2_9HYPH|nr:terminase TerL endonuclease subunit [Gellertiella hungarica]MBB4064734.1 phage terminase large subunit-like protein [Gellertiella hungarica]